MEPTAEELHMKHAELQDRLKELYARDAALDVEGASMMEKYNSIKDKMGAIEMDMWEEMYAEQSDKKGEIVAALRRHEMELNQLITQYKLWLEASEKQDKDAVTASGDSADDEE